MVLRLEASMHSRAQDVGIANLAANASPPGFTRDKGRLTSPRARLAFVRARPPIGPPACLLSDFGETLPFQGRSLARPCAREPRVLAVTLAMCTWSFV